MGAMSTCVARERFRAIIRRPEARLSLAEAALCIAWEDQGACDVEGALRELDRIADRARPAVESYDDPRAVVTALGAFMVGEMGFRGNTWRYNDPQNSFLDRVLVTRTGLPIALAAVYMEVGWRLALPLAGLALPGHFLVQYRAESGGVYFDPFYRGRIWSYAECERQVAAYYGAVTPEVMRQVLAPPSKAAILERMLRNLKNAYLERADEARTLAAAERLLLLRPEDAAELRDYGMLLGRAGRVLAAREALERYARLAPDAPDLAAVRKQAAALAQGARHN
jgi:regulator of sirC expression with transglutaminase-like and TPR domain